MNYLIIFIALISIVYAEKSFTIDKNNAQFVKDGKPFRYISGDLEYFKIPSVLWKDRMIKHKAAGLNAIQTYIEWNSHEPEKGVYEFSGDNDLVEFLKLAHEMDFVVILRPGPFINAERDMGGLPYWLLSENPHMKLRTMEKSYITEVDKWFSVLLPKLVPLLYKNGGPIITVQVENEYGFEPSCDHKYLEHMRDLFYRYLGNDVILFTTDPDSQLKCGMIDKVLTTIDFGSNVDVDKVFASLRSHRKESGPLINSEYYPGWIDVWEEQHTTRSTNDVCKTLDKILAINASVNIYPLIGGTSFGFGAGGKIHTTNNNKVYIPCVTSYDFDAPLSEAGDARPKYFAMRDIISKYVKLPTDIPEVLHVESPKMELSPIDMHPIKTIYADEFQKNPIETKYPQTFEALKLRHGFVLYSTQINVHPSDPAVLTVNGLSDRAQVFVDFKYQGTLSRTHNIHQLPINAQIGSRLDIFVENQGRLCFGNHMVVNDLKGIKENVTLGHVTLTNWKQYRYFTEWEKVIKNIEKENANHTQHLKKNVPTFFTGDFKLPNDPKLPHDTFLRLNGWKKGVAFLNGFNLGRYWPIAGPQITLYTPAHLFKKYPDTNIITVFELEGSPCSIDTNKCTVQFVKYHEINGTTPYSHHN